MNDKEKLAQLEAGREQSASQSNEPNDLPILFPENESYMIADRKYVLKPFKMRQERQLMYFIKALKALAETPKEKINEDTVLKLQDDCVDFLSVIFNEPDKEFLIDNISLQGENSDAIKIVTFLSEFNMRGVVKKKVIS